MSIPMKSLNRRTVRGIAVLLALLLLWGSGAALASPQGSLALRGWTVDSGGVLLASSGSLSLSGTAGQPDAASPLTSGTYTLSPGFWPGGAAKYKAFLPVMLRG